MFVCENTCSRWQNRIWNHWRGKQRIGNQRETCSSGVGQGGRELPTSWAGCCHLGLDWVAWQISGHPLGTEAEQGRLTTNDFFTVSRASMFLSDELRPAMCLELLPQAISLGKNRKKFFAWNGLNRKIKPRDSRISKKFFAKLKFSPLFWKTLVKFSSPKYSPLHKVCLVQRFLALNLCYIRLACIILSSWGSFRLNSANVASQH